MMRRSLALAPLALLAAACGAPPANETTPAGGTAGNLVAPTGEGPQVANAWIRLPAVPGRPAAAYFTLTGGADDETLLAARTPAANRAELHESAMANGTMTMREIRDIPVPAGGTVAFEPGGKHVMLFDLDPALAAGGTAPMTLSFAGAGEVTVDAALVAPGDSGPHGGAH